jgi:hypothetical protein
VMFAGFFPVYLAKKKDEKFCGVYFSIRNVQYTIYLVLLIYGFLIEICWFV